MTHPRSDRNLPMMTGFDTWFSVPNDAYEDRRLTFCPAVSSDIMWDNATPRSMLTTPCVCDKRKLSDPSHVNISPWRSPKLQR